ncbi:MAG: hypothetical protein Q9195_003721 [Heterodermia aff. obscurata]
MDDLRQTLEQHRDGVTSLKAATRQCRVAQRKAIGTIRVSDFADVYKDEERHKEWIESHLQHAQGELHLQLEELKPSEAFLEMLAEKERAIRQEETAVPQVTEKSEAVLVKVQELFSYYPEVKAKLFQASLDPASVQDDFDLRMGKTMEALRRDLQEQALDDLTAQFSLVSDWDNLVKSVEMRSAPRLAFNLVKDVNQVGAENDQLRAVNTSLQSDLEGSREKVDQSERMIDDLRGQIERESSRREHAEQELDKFKLSAQNQAAKIHKDTLHQAQKAERKLTELESTVGRLRSDLTAANDAAASERQKFEQNLDAQRAQFKSDLDKTRQDLAEERDKLASVTEGSDTAQADLKTARDSLASVEDKLREQVEALRESRAQVAKSNDDLQRENGRRKAVEAELSSAQLTLSERNQSLQSANQRLGEVDDELRRMTGSRDEAQRSLRDANTELDAQRRSRVMLEESAESVRQERDAVQAASRLEKAKHVVTQQRLDQSLENEKACSERDRVAIEELQAMLDTERAAHDRTRDLRNKEVESLTRMQSRLMADVADAKKEREAYKADASTRIDFLEKDAQDQQQAVTAFAKYCFGGLSAVALPSVKEMQTLHSKRYGQSLSDNTTGLPAIVFVNGHLPAAWLYLSFASGGVSINSRFNQTTILPTVASELSWIHDAVARAVNAVSKETMTAELQCTLIVVLQGIAYVHLAARLWMDKSFKPEPSALLASLAHIERGNGSVLGMIHQQVYNLVHHRIQITDWVRDGFSGEKFNATNAALPQGVALIHRDTPGTVFLAHSSVGLFVIDEQELNAEIGYMSAKLRLPAGVPDDLRQMDLANVEHTDALHWAINTFIRH